MTVGAVRCVVLLRVVLVCVATFLYWAGGCLVYAMRGMKRQLLLLASTAGAGGSFTSCCFKDHVALFRPAVEVGAGLADCRGARCARLPKNMYVPSLYYYSM